MMVQETAMTDEEIEEGTGEENEERQDALGECNSSVINALVRRPLDRHRGAD
jgi:hypothetical protein